MIVDLHNHTSLCNHATGAIDEYIKTAIKNETIFFGFADHAPMDFDTEYRMKFEDMQKYESAVKSAKNIYKKEIEILLGYEVDYLVGHMDKRVLNADVDYLIGSVHFLEGWGFDNPAFLSKWKEKDIDAVWQKYFDTIEAMAKSRLFNIVGHLDLIKIFNFMPKRTIQEIAKDALFAIKENNMVIEVNTAGYRKPTKEPYPSYELLQQAFKLDIPITLSSDAHHPKQVGLYGKKIIKIIKEIGYTKVAYFVNKKLNFINI